MDIGIIGLGLIGGSLGLSLKNRDWNGRIYGYDINNSYLNKAISLNIIDEKKEKLEDLVNTVSVVVIAVPVSRIAELIKNVAAINSKVIITDVGSVKDSIIKEIDSNINYIPAHPIAGTENSGPEAAIKDLFSEKRIILCKKSKIIEEMWTFTGGKIEFMDSKKHDTIFAAVSHLPHLIAYSIVDSIVELEEQNDAFFKYIASGFKDFTRIASSDPIMWSDVFIENRENLLFVLDYFKKSIEKLENKIKSHDKENLKNILKEVKMVRDSAIKEMKK